MPKGQFHNPSSKKDGIWFPHIGTSNTLPMTSTQEMFYRSKTAYREDRTLPFIQPTSVTTKTEVQKTYPYSFHDNRHLLQSSAEYFDSEFGRRKISSTNDQHTSHNFNFYCHDPPPKATSAWNGFTVYQTSYWEHQGPRQTFLRRYPKSHLEHCRAPDYYDAPR
ncbi:testis-expressed protein 36 [Xenopus laevis]|uniref:Testis-expressed protein 36 n=2 Tax=Xenopus laevis TaxID=8355 RepID=A0A1L8FEH9_XENLA|nr:testis-expressed protein 36 [Xenopus laevis]OCT69957.1 hypothetical protein XELAEV_18036883mg [Xenopus laevis]